MDQLRISIPFVGGVTAIYNKEEVMNMKEQVKKAVRSAAVSCLVYSLVGAEVATRVASNALCDAGEALLETSREMAKVHELVYTELKYINEGEVLPDNVVVMDCDGQIA